MFIDKQFKRFLYLKVELFNCNFEILIPYLYGVDHLYYLLPSPQLVEFKLPNIFCTKVIISRGDVMVGVQEKASTRLLNMMLDMVDKAKRTDFWWMEYLEFFHELETMGMMMISPKLITESINIPDKVEDVQRPKMKKSE